MFIVICAYSYHDYYALINKYEMKSFAVFNHLLSIKKTYLKYLNKCIFCCAILWPKMAYVYYIYTMVYFYCVCTL